MGYMYPKNLNFVFVFTVQYTCPEKEWMQHSGPPKLSQIPWGTMNVKFELRRGAKKGNAQGLGESLNVCFPVRIPFSAILTFVNV